MWYSIEIAVIFLSNLSSNLSSNLLHVSIFRWNFFVEVFTYTFLCDAFKNIYTVWTSKVRNHWIGSYNI